MNKALWTFGCSFTEDSNNFLKEAPYWKDYLSYKKVKNIPVWSTILSSFLQLKDNNFGYGGVGNDYIFEKFIEQAPNMEQGDYVVIQWSSFNRIQFPFLYGNEFKSNNIHIRNFIGGNSYRDGFPKNIEKGAQYISIVNSCKYILDKFHDRVKFLIDYCEARKINLFFWCMELENDYVLDIVKQYPNYFYNESNNFHDESNDFNLVERMHNYGELLQLRFRIEDDTFGKVDDVHPSEQGHRLIAVFLLQFINRQQHRIYE